MEVDQAALEEAIQEFGAWRLLSFDRDPRSGTPTIEVAHEALMREWGRFRRWIDSGREEVRLHRRLASAAREWQEAGREASYLLRGSNLAQFELLAGESTIALTELEREFVEASTAANELELARQRRQNRRLRLLLSGAVALLVLAVVAGALALVSRSNAQREAQVALGRQLGAEAVSEPRIDLSMLLARESLNLDRSTQTEGTLLATLLRTPAVIGTFTVPIQARPQDVEVSPDGHSIAAITNNNVMRIYDARTLRQIREFDAANFVYAYVPSSSYLFVFEPRPPYAHFWLVNPRTGRPLRTFTISKLWLNSPSSNGPALASGDGRYGFFPWAAVNQDGSNGPAYIESWRLDHGGPSHLARLRGTGMVAASALPGDRVMVATDGRIVTWDAKMQREIRSVPGPTFGPNEFVNGAISPDGRTFAYGLENGKVYFFHISSGKTVAGQGEHSAAVQRIAFSPDSKLAVSTGDDGLAILWNPATSKPLARLTGHSGRVIGVDFSPDGRALYTAGLDGTILEYGLGGTRRFGSPFSLPRGRAARLNSALPSTPLLAVSPDGRLFAASALGNGNAQSSVQIESVAPLRRVATISLAPQRSVSAGAWAGGHFVLGADRGLVQLWSVAGGKARPARTLRGLSPRGQVRSVATADGGRVVAAVDGWQTPPKPPGGQLAIWRDGRLVAKPLNLAMLGNAVALSSDGGTAAAATDDGRLVIVDVKTGKVERTIRPKIPSGGITAVAFSPDGTLANGGWNGIVNLWNPKTGQSIGHPTLVAPAPVASIAFAPDGRTFATSGGSSGGTRIWVTATQQRSAPTSPAVKASGGMSPTRPTGATSSPSLARPWGATPAAATAGRSR